MSNATANISVQADTVTWNGSPLDVTDLATRQTIAFVAQDDSLPITSTPREAIMFSARLRLDKDLTQSELEEITDTMLSQLHLENCADTLVGGALLKGISGGERKRTSVGVELGKLFIWENKALLFLSLASAHFCWQNSVQAQADLFRRANVWTRFFQCPGVGSGVEAGGGDGIRRYVDHPSTFF